MIGGTKPALGQCAGSSFATWFIDVPDGFNGGLQRMSPASYAFKRAPIQQVFSPCIRCPSLHPPRAWKSGLVSHVNGFVCLCDISMCYSEVISQLGDPDRDGNRLEWVITVWAVGLLPVQTGTKVFNSMLPLKCCSTPLLLLLLLLFLVFSWAKIQRFLVLRLLLCVITLNGTIPFVGVFL